MRNRQIYVRRMDFPTRVDKTARAQAICGRMAMDGLYLPAGAPWVPDFRAELLTFSHGRHDDQVDALSLIGQMLNLMRPGRPATARPKPRTWQELTMDEAWELLRVKPK